MTSMSLQIIYSDLSDSDKNIHSRLLLLLFFLLVSSFWIRIKNNLYLLFVLDFGDFCQPFESDNNVEDYPYSASTIILQFQTNNINAPVGSGFVLKFVRNNITLEESTTQVATDNISFKLYFFGIVPTVFFILSLKGEVCVHLTTSIPLRFTEVLVPSQDSARTCICVFEVSILPLF